MSPAEHPSSARRGRVRTGWLVAATFALGAVTGGLAVTTMDDRAGGAAVTGPSTAARPSSDVPPPADGVEAGLTNACLRAVTAAEQVYAALEDAGNAIAALDARRLDEVLHEVRPLRDQLRAGTAACDVDVRRPGRAIGTDVPALPPAGQ